MKTFIIIAVVVVLLIIVFSTIGTRNRFEKLRRAIKAEASNVGIYREKRGQTLSDLVKIAKKHYENEVAGIEKLTAKDQFDQLAYLGQKFPELQSIGAFNEQMRQVGTLNAEIAAAKAIVNANIQNYNDEINNFPGLIVAKMFGYQDEKFIDEDGIEENKKVNMKDFDLDDVL